MTYTGFPQFNNFPSARVNETDSQGSYIKKYAQQYIQAKSHSSGQSYNDTFVSRKITVNGEKTDFQSGQISNTLKNLLSGSDFQPILAVRVERKRIQSKEGVWINDLKQTLNEKKAVIYAMTPRTFNAYDKNGDELIDMAGGERRGSFLNAIDRLDELKNIGVNTIHLLPITPPARENALGTAGSLYAPESYTEIDPALDDPDDPRNVYEEAREFVKEAHKRNIRIMVDLPSCASVSMAERNPHLIAVNDDGSPRVPQGWNDIRAFQVWEDKENGELNRPLMEMHKKFVDMIMDIGADGIRADVARYKPPRFWKELIGYAREKDPQFGFLAESYTYEDASPMANIPADRPEPLLNAGFDSIYGQYHIFPSWNTANDLHSYVKNMIKMSHRLPPNKSLIGSFATHDDKAPISNGGVPYSNLTVGLQATLPMVNPYFVSGFESGDNYIYKFRNKYVEKSDTDSHIAFVHPEWIDIFNYSRRPGGNHPEIGDYMGKIFNVRKKYENVITKGSYIPLEVENNENDRIIAYARHYKGKTLLVIANRNVNGYESGEVKVPLLSKNQQLKDLSPSYDVASRIEVIDEALNVKLGPARFHLFEINTPNIEKAAKEVYTPNQQTSSGSIGLLKKLIGNTDLSGQN